MAGFLPYMGPLLPSGVPKHERSLYKNSVHDALTVQLLQIIRMELWQ
jgi:hypothetical protein